MLQGVKADAERKAAQRRRGLLLATFKPERKPDCRRLGVSGREEVEVTSLSGSRSLVVRNKVFVQRSSKEEGCFWMIN